MQFAIAPSDASCRGARNYHDGLVAEGTVERAYAERGCRVLDRRWRGRAGELDLVLDGPEGVIVVEVKKAMSHAAAAERILPRQLARIAASAEDYASRNFPGAFVAIRVDAALVDCHGRVEIIENITMH